MRLGFAALALLRGFCSQAFAEEMTPAFCRKVCDHPDRYAGWCIRFGSSAKKTATPYISILEAVKNGGASIRADSCEQKITVANNILSIDGSACSVVQKGLSDLKLISRLPKSATAIISNTAGALDIVFKDGLFHFGLETSKYSSVGPVSFVTTHLDTNGESKVIWTNGEWCFTAFVNY